MNLSRRSFLMAAVAAAPAVILTPGLLMPVKKLWTPPNGGITVRGFDPASAEGDYTTWVIMDWDWKDTNTLKITDWGPKDRGTFVSSGTTWQWKPSHV